MLVKKIRKAFREILLRYPPLYRIFLKRHYGTKFPPPAPQWPIISAVLKTKKELEQANKLVQFLSFPPHPTPEKNWDSITALKCILENVSQNGRVLDAGATIDSVILPWLFAFGYKHLHAMNLDIKKEIKRGRIHYKQGDITSSYFVDDFFDAIICQSVIEHGVNENKFLHEMLRILKNGGVLFISTDYWEEPINTSGIRAFGAPYTIFSPDTINNFLEKARDAGFIWENPSDLHCAEKLITWDQVGLSYTFITLILRKDV
jgi:SAM-dependent methyltransferase